MHDVVLAEDHTFSSANFTSALSNSRVKIGKVCGTVVTRR